VKHRFDEIAVRITQQGSGFQAWAAGILTGQLATSGKTGLKKTLWQIRIASLESQMDMTMLPARCCRDKQFVGPEVVRAFGGQVSAQNLQYSTVKLFAGGQIVHKQMNVVKQSTVVVFHGTSPLAKHPEIPLWLGSRQRQGSFFIGQLFPHHTPLYSRCPCVLTSD
jgi:hypothetical protein